MDIIYIHGGVFITIFHGFTFKSGPTTWILDTVTPLNNKSNFYILHFLNTSTFLLANRLYRQSDIHGGPKGPLAMHVDDDDL